MRIVFFGDSITDSARDREYEHSPTSYGNGYVKFISGELIGSDPTAYEIYNRGIRGDKSVDLYARIKNDVWNLTPDVLSILVGVNDVWSELSNGSGVEIERYERVYRMMIEDTMERLPNVKIMLLEPYVLHGTATDGKFEWFEEVYRYAAVVKRLAKEYGLQFVPLQERLSEGAEKHGAAYYAFDGIHPATAGAVVIAKAWLQAFENMQTKAR